jgi:aminoglycoside phosphotransferase (APT) family kinase protein
MHGPTGLVLAYILTLIHRIDNNQHEMRMVNRESKERKPDWAFTQKWFDRLRPESDSRLKTQWAVTIKT